MSMCFGGGFNRACFDLSVFAMFSCLQAVTAPAAGTVTSACTIALRGAHLGVLRACKRNRGSAYTYIFLHMCHIVLHKIVCELSFGRVHQPVTDDDVVVPHLQAVRRLLFRVQVLGVPTTADTATIRQAYRSIIRQVPMNYICEGVHPCVSRVFRSCMHGFVSVA
jgi:hypothetical protein